MATLIPTLGNCTARMTPGERRLAERLEQKLEDDYLLWCEVPVGLKLWTPISSSATEPEHSSIQRSLCKPAAGARCIYD